MRRTVCYQIGCLIVALLTLTQADGLALDPRQPLNRYARAVWQRKDGLPPGSINSMTQTGDGYLWLATEAGLVRFDGVRFKLFDVVPELARTSIGKLYVSRDGTLWLGARRGRLISYKDGKFTAYVLTEEPREDHIRAIVEDRAGNLWVGLPGGGLIKFKAGQTVAITTKDGLGDNFVMAVAEARDGAIWVGTRAGVSRIAEGRVVTFNEKDGLRKPWVNAIYQSQNGQSQNGQARDDSIWLGTFGGGVYRFKDGKFTPFGERDGVTYLWAIQEDRAGNIWVGGEGSGLSRFEQGRFISTTAIGNPPGLLPDDSVRSLCEDREGNLWLGLKYGGLVRLKDRRFPLYSRATGLPDDYVQALYQEADGSFWVGTRGGLSWVKDGQYKNYTTRDGLADNTVTALYRDRAGTLWIGTRGDGVGRLKDGRLNFVGQGAGVRNVVSLYEGCDGALWLGTNVGRVWRLKDGQFTTYAARDGLPNSDVRMIIADGQCNIWVGTRDGLARFDGARFVTYKTADGLASNHVRSLLVDRAGNLWIGHQNGALDCFRDGKFTPYAFKDAAPNSAIYLMLQDGGDDLWLCYRRRIARIQRAEIEAFAQGKLAAITPAFHDPSDAIENNECTANSRSLGADNRSQRLLVPTVKGVLVIDTEQGGAGNQPPPPVLIEEVLSDDQIINAQAQLPSVNRGRLEFHYTALHFTAPEKLRFKYKLEGFDQQWLQAGARRVAYYTNLPPGPYRFRVSAGSNDGVWNEPGAWFDFYLKPRFYQTYWFYALCAVALGLLAWGFYLLRVRRVEARYAAILQERLAERTRVAREMHDTLIQGVVAISAQLEAISATITDAPATAQAHLERVRALARQSLDEARRSIWDLRPQALDEADLPTAIERAARQLANGQVERIEVTGAPRPLPGMVEANILRICQEAIANAVKHAGASRIRVALEYETQAVRLRVADDGRGFDPEAQGPSREHIGLLGMRERARAIRGRLHLQSQPGVGTEVSLIVPV